MEPGFEGIPRIRLSRTQCREILAQLTDARGRLGQVLPPQLLEEIVDRCVRQTPRPSRRLWIESVVAATSVAACPQWPVTRS